MNICWPVRAHAGENLSPDTAGHMTHITYADCCLAQRQPIRTAVYPHVLNRLMAGSSCLSRTMRVRSWLPTSLLKITHCHCLHYCVGDVIMPARSNSSSRHALSAMYPGVQSVVWRSDAIPQVAWMVRDVLNIGLLRYLIFYCVFVSF
jgi:hypothetical protein